MNFHRIYAIATVTFRDAIRSRLLGSLVLFLMLGLVALPSLIQGDGSLPGRIQIIIRYALGFALFVLSVVTLWTACGGMAREIEDRRFYLIASKPIHRHEIWLGKWLATVVLNAGLLMLAGLTLSGMLAWTLHGSGSGSPAQDAEIRQLLLARTTVPAQPGREDFEERVAQETKTILESGRAPAGISAAELTHQMRRHLLRLEYSLAPQGSTALIFPLPHDRLPGREATLLLHSASSHPERRPFVIRWQLGRDGQAMSFQTTNYPAAPWQQRIPASVLSADATLGITLRRGEDQDPATLILAPDGRTPELLVPVGEFGANLARALLVMLCRLAFLAALGLTAGSLFSMPVAVFVSFFAIVLLASAGYVETVSHSGAFYVAHEGPQPGLTWLDAVVLRMFKGLNSVTEPVLKLDPVPLLAEGRLVSWAMTGRAVLFLGALYTGVIAALGTALFRKRELG
ncbi:MAG: ABC transporter permease [bacterium]